MKDTMQPAYVVLIVLSTRSMHLIDFSVHQECKNSGSLIYLYHRF